MKNSSIIFLTLLTNIFSFSICFADDATDSEKYHIANLTFENDVFTKKDEGYTDGLRLGWLAPESNTPKWIKYAAKKLPGIDEGKKHISLSIGQGMFTPSDLSKPGPIKDDQPYAGWLYGSLGIIADQKDSLNNAMLTIGVIGPLSYAKQTQKKVHHIIGASNPQGWNHQLNNEPGINFSYEKKWKNVASLRPNTFGADFTPDASFTVGNINTNISTGGSFRIGYDLPQDFGPPRIRTAFPSMDFFVPKNMVGGYIFLSTHVQWVLRNIFLDGNSFKYSTAVKKKPLVADAQIGFVLNYKDLRFSYSHIFMTKEFETQKKASEYGSVSISYRF